MYISLHNKAILVNHTMLPMKLPDGPKYLSLYIRSSLSAAAAQKKLLTVLLHGTLINVASQCSMNWAYLR
jgi:hypothetical protein